MSSVFSENGTDPVRRGMHIYICMPCMQPTAPHTRLATRARGKTARARGGMKAHAQGPEPRCSRWLWFAGLHEGKRAGGCATTAGYYEGYSAALASAQFYASEVLVPVLLLGRFGLEDPGALSPFGRWAAFEGVTVFPVASLNFQEDIMRTGYSGGRWWMVRECSLPARPDHCQGPYLRLHIVSIMRKYHEQLFSQQPDLCRENVIYTDSDVMFVRPMRPIDVRRAIDASPPEAAVLYGAEESRSVSHPVNTGVMFINVPRFERLLPELLAFGRAHNFSFPMFDQGWLNAFFETREGSALLDARWNWKVYWGASSEPSTSTAPADGVEQRVSHSRLPYVVHWHGPKPGAGYFLDCLASMNPACLDALESRHPYWDLCARGFKEDGGRLANTTLRAYRRFAASCHEWESWQDPRGRG